MKKIKAGLFDFDGVLANTMEDNFLAWKRAFKNYNVEIKKEDYFPLEGMKVTEVAEVIGTKYKVSETHYSNIVKLKNKYYLEDHSFSFYPGVVELINFLKEKGLLLAIVSASPREKLQKTVPTEFLDKFDAIMSGDDVKTGKPDPESYLKAMKKLKVSPHDCVIIENAPLGIKAAKATGAYCIAITTTLNKEYLAEADKIISEFRELEKFFI